MSAAAPRASAPSASETSAATTSAPALLPEAELDRHAAAAARLKAGLDAILFGQARLTELTLTGLIAGGHLLLEGLPGLGKTELVKGLAALSGLAFRRVQFTPDLLPGDITGTMVLEQVEGRRELVFRPGPLFAEIVLADEINRASPKTQSALLEAMQEHSVTVPGGTHHLPEPFFVLATQNPVELDGTYPLPEAQLDRFALKLAVHGVGPDTLSRILLERPAGRPEAPAPVTDREGLRSLMAAVQRIALPAPVADYIARLVCASNPLTDEAPALVKRSVRYGCSPRAGLALASCARAAALVAGRPAVGFDDVDGLAEAVMGHRLILAYEATVAGTGSGELVRALVEHTPRLPE